VHTWGRNPTIPIDLEPSVESGSIYGGQPAGGKQMEREIEELVPVQNGRIPFSSKEFINLLKT